MTQLQDRSAGRPDASALRSPVSTSGRRDWQRISLFAGGVLFAVGNLLHPLEHDEAALHTATWQAAHLTIFASITLLVLGLPHLHRRLAARTSPLLATVAVAASVVGLIGIAPGSIIETFVAPMIGHHAMEELESGGFGAFAGVTAIAYLGGTIALGWAVGRAKLRPRWAGPALVVSAVVPLCAMGVTGPVGGAVIIGATVIYGAALAALAVSSEAPAPAP